MELNGAKAPEEPERLACSRVSFLLLIKGAGSAATGARGGGEAKRVNLLKSKRSAEDWSFSRPARAQAPSLVAT